MRSHFVGSWSRFFLIVSVAFMSAISRQGLFADEPPSGVDLTVATLDALALLLDSAPRDRYESQEESAASYESILCELVRRRGPAAEQVLLKQLAKIEEKKKGVHDRIKSLLEESDEVDEQERLLKELSHDLELVAALRRIRKQPDPLAVEIDLPDELEAWTRELPAFEVELRNVDADKRDISFQLGGDYRSGRHARWRIHVWDSAGHLLPELPSPSFIGGGISQQAHLTFDETWDLTLPLESYVRIRKPGKYKLQVLYHDSETIANFRTVKDLESLIVFQSEILEFNVEHGPMISIQLKAGSTEQAGSLIRRLNEDTPLKIVIGKYDETVHGFMSPKSPEGELLAMQWQAVPALIDELKNKDLSFRKRAWILALLFSITLENELNPMESGNGLLSRGILPDYETKGSLVTSMYWNGGGSYQFSVEGVRSGGKANIDEQLSFAQKWFQFRDEYLDIQSEE